MSLLKKVWSWLNDSPAEYDNDNQLTYEMLALIS